MTDPVLAQVLTMLTTLQKGVSDLTAEVRATNTGNAARLTSLESTRDDHEARLRTIEQDDYVTRDDMESSAKERNKKLIGWLSLLFVGIGLIETAIIAIVVNKGP